MERICERIKARHEEISVDQAKVNATVIPLRLTFR
jgi:hypothetical protein